MEKTKINENNNQYQKKWTKNNRKINRIEFNSCFCLCVNSVDKAMHVWMPTFFFGSSYHFIKKSLVLHMQNSLLLHMTWQTMCWSEHDGHHGLDGGSHVFIHNFVSFCVCVSFQIDERFGESFIWNPLISVCLLGEEECVPKNSTNILVSFQHFCPLCLSLTLTHFWALFCFVIKTHFGTLAAFWAQSTFMN